MTANNTFKFKVLQDEFYEAALAALVRQYAGASPANHICVFEVRSAMLSKPRFSSSRPKRVARREALFSVNPAGIGLRF